MDSDGRAKAVQTPFPHGKNRFHTQQTAGYRMERLEIRLEHIQTEVDDVVNNQIKVVKSEIPDTIKGNVSKFVDESETTEREGTLIL